LYDLIPHSSIHPDILICMPSVQQSQWQPNPGEPGRGLKSADLKNRSTDCINVYQLYNNCLHISTTGYPCFRIFNWKY
jgi:hypothetical protein